jgi:hypothetical protein
LRKAHTLSSLCGVPSATNPFGSGANTKSSTVNGTVQILDTTTGAVSTYYINKTGSVYHWRASSAADNFDFAPIGLGKGFLVVNQKSTPITFPVSGDYRTARSRFVALGGKKYLLANPGITDATFTTSTIALESPNRATGIPRSKEDEYGIWQTTTKAFKYYTIGGTTNTLSVYELESPVSPTPTISKFTSVLAKPYGTNPCILTIAPAPAP